MEFYKETKITKPRKKHLCFFCNREIIGEHYYIVGNNGNMVYMRSHIDCKAIKDLMCSSCELNGDCDFNIKDCFYEQNQRFRIKD